MGIEARPLFSAVGPGGMQAGPMPASRAALAEEIVRDLRQGPEAAKHWLVRGRPGSGLTHLLGAVLGRLGGGTWTPVVLGEIPRYRVFSAAALLLVALEELDHRASRGALLAGLPHTDGDDPRLLETLKERLEGWTAEHGPLLVVAEELDRIIGGFAPKAAATEVDAVQSLFTELPEVRFLVTSAPVGPRWLEARGPDAWGLEVRDLPPLTEGEVRALLGAEGLSRGTAIWAARVLQRLSGGNARAVIAGAHALRRRGGGRLVPVLEEVLDLLTPAVRGRLRELSPRERVVVAVLGVSPRNLTPREVADASRLPERSLATQLRRLVEAGHLEARRLPDGRGSVYAVTDPLVRLWSRWRRQDLDLEALLRFLVPHVHTRIEILLRDALDSLEPPPGEASEATDPRVAAVLYEEETLAAEGRHEQALDVALGLLQQVPEQQPGSGDMVRLTGLLVEHAMRRLASGDGGGAVQLLQELADHLEHLHRSELASWTHGVRCLLAVAVTRTRGTQEGQEVLEMLFGELVAAPPTPRLPGLDAFLRWLLVTYPEAAVRRWLDLLGRSRVPAWQSSAEWHGVVLDVLADSGQEGSEARARVPAELVATVDELVARLAGVARPPAAGKSRVESGGEEGEAGGGAQEAESHA